MHINLKSSIVMVLVTFLTTLSHAGTPKKEIREISAYTRAGIQIAMRFQEPFSPQKSHVNKIGWTSGIGCEEEIQIYAHSIQIDKDILYLVTSNISPLETEFPQNAEAFILKKIDHPWSSEALDIFTSTNGSFPFGIAHDSIIITVPTSADYKSGVSSFASCPDMGFSGTFIDVVIDIEQAGQLKNWVCQIGAKLFQDAQSEYLDTDAASSGLNGWSIELPDNANADEILQDLRTKDWVISAKQV